MTQWQSRPSSSLSWLEWDLKWQLGGCKWNSVLSLTYPQQTEPFTVCWKKYTARFGRFNSHFGLSPQTAIIWHWKHNCKDSGKRTLLQHALELGCTNPKALVHKSSRNSIHENYSGPCWAQITFFKSQNYPLELKCAAPELLPNQLFTHITARAYLTIAFLAQTFEVLFTCQAWESFVKQSLHSCSEFLH